MIRRLLERLTSRMTPRVIFDREGVSPYLSRFYLLGRPYMKDGSAPIDKFGNPHEAAVFPRGIGVYLHKFHRSDQDYALHSHPWLWAYSIILAGGYLEERRFSSPTFWRHKYKYIVKRFIRRPGHVVSIKEDDFHRVDLLEKDSWSLFIAGPKVSSWGFWDRKTGEFLPWREFIAKVRGKEWA